MDGRRRVGTDYAGYVTTRGGGRMSALGEGLYIGAVVHKRLTPRHHALRYTVFSCLFDCSRLDSLSARLRLFSLN
ncbi:MAG: DUF1365 family protein, partial [Burkholderiales bacterium]|nr:DUF1365 family protein [Burkholderiales bacterium]